MENEKFLKINDRIFKIIKRNNSWVEEENYSQKWIRLKGNLWILSNSKESFSGDVIGAREVKGS